MNLQEVKELLKLIAKNNQTKQQEDAFTEWLDNSSREDYLTVLNVWEELVESQTDYSFPNPKLISRIEVGLSNIDAPVVPLNTYPERIGKRSLRINIAIAASLLLMLSVGLFSYYASKESVHMVSTYHLNDIEPGGNKAILTLSDGSRINLNDINKGEVSNQAGIKIVKSDDGQLIYTVINAIASQNENLFNTIETPKGGQYRVNLPDGSMVWLNAASSLRYPINFNSEERKVELTGEAYFEIAKDKTKPFRVVSKNQTVEVLGTHFNIDSYTDEEDTKTTLLEGSVKIQSATNNRVIVLKPGQQSQVEGYTMNVSDVDVNDVAAWKDGYFVFTAESIPSVMRKIARWYDLEVVYEGDIKDKDLTGSVSRFTNVSGILKTLELTRLVHFKIEGKKITVIAN